MENPGNSSPDNLIVEALKQLVQENQALNNKVGVIEMQMDAMRIQMTEMIGILQTLKNGTPTEATAVVNPGGTAAEPVAIVSPNGVTSFIAPPVSVSAAATIPPGPAAHPQNAAQPGGYYHIMDSPQGHMFGGPPSEDEIRALEERIKVIEGAGVRAKDARELCLVPDLVLPPKFKMPNFEKYKGLTCPESHVTMYARMMGPYASNDKLLIYCFQNSLAGAPLNWYMQLQASDIHCWKDLSGAFLKQYQFNMDMAPDRSQLQHMNKRDNESFKEYAQRWRALAAQVAPPLLEKELVLMFLETLPPLYYDKLMSVSSSFSDMVIIGERLENGLRSGRIAHGSAGASVHKNPSSGFPAKKNEETNAITGQKKPPRYDPIPVPYADLCSYLIDHDWIFPRKMNPVQPPFPRGYNPQATCEFHSGAIGHSAENCHPFKQLVQGFIDSRQLTFKQGGEISMIGPDSQD